MKCADVRSNDFNFGYCRKLFCIQSVAKCFGGVYIGELMVNDDDIGVVQNAMDAVGDDAAVLSKLSRRLQE